MQVIGVKTIFWREILIWIPLSPAPSSHMLSEGFTCLKYVNLNKLDKNLLLKFSKQFSRGHALSLDSSGQHQHRPLYIYNYKIPTLDLQAPTQSSQPG